jgi:hypothetical protein
MAVDGEKPMGIDSPGEVRPSEGNRLGRGGTLLMAGVPVFVIRAKRRVGGCVSRAA